MRSRSSPGPSVSRLARAPGQCAAEDLRDYFPVGYLIGQDQLQLQAAQCHAQHLAGDLIGAVAQDPGQSEVPIRGGLAQCQPGVGQGIEVRLEDGGGAVLAQKVHDISGERFCHIRVVRQSACPLLELFHATLRGPTATASREGSFYGRYRLCAIDGTILTLADIEQNRYKYSKHAGHHGGTGYPQARLLALIACGTRSIMDVVFGPTTIGETTYTPQLLRSMDEGMLIMADRNFASAGLLHQLRKTGAQFLVRVKLGRQLPVRQILPDGFYLSVLAGQPVRGLTANITVHAETTRRTETYRLVTSMCTWTRPASACPSASTPAVPGSGA
ncbi:hypothetical protein CIK74_03335 [Glutamicibacter sp. BW77]|nr:hypothetical protein CIK74_03335 [Glutamicibacter sp. BW77]